MNIFQKLIEVRKAVPYLKKETVGYQFKFVSSSQTLAAVRAKMDDMQLLLIPSVTSKTVSETSTAKGNKEHFTELEMDFMWVNADDPTERIICHWYGQGLDTGEKGVGKALTYAEKYFLLKFFNIPTDKDDPDAFQDRTENGSHADKPKAKVDPDAQLKRELYEKNNHDAGLAKAEYDDIMKKKLQAKFEQEKMEA